MKHLVGVGSEHDRAIHVWKFEVKTKKKLDIIYVINNR